MVRFDGAQYPHACGVIVAFKAVRKIFNRWL